MRDPAGSFERLVPAEQAAAPESKDEPEELPPLHARGVGEMLDIAVDVMRARFSTCVLLSASLWVPVMVFERLGVGLEDEAQLVHAWLAILLALPVNLVTIALVTLIVYGHLQGHPVGIRRAMMLGLKRGPSLLVSTVVSTVIIWLGAMMCIVPGVWIAWLWSVATAALVLEGLGPMEALSRSAALVRGSFGRWLGLVTVTFTMMLPFYAVAGLLVLPELRTWSGTVLSMSGPVFDASYILLSALLKGIGTALFGIVLTVLYIDTRVRSEGLDLAMRIERARDRDAALTGLTPA